MNSECYVNNHAPSCHCLSGYTGDPFRSCHLIPGKFIIDLYILVIKTIFNNKKIIYITNFNKQKKCYIYQIITTVERDEPIGNPCQPSPCGPNSYCRLVNNRAVCSCKENYIGAPPSCRPECMVSSDCPQDKACKNAKCQDPCPGVCGFNARCTAVNHNPICSCNTGFTGDPFVRCLEDSKNLNVIIE